MSFVKLDSNIVTSSVWAEDSDTLRVWLYLLATADADGFVRATVPGIAIQCRLSVDVVRRALDKFSLPDPDSRTSKNEGRRIRIQREPQFKILVVNYRDYRRKDHTHAARQARYRERLKLRGESDGVTPSRAASRDASRSRSRKDKRLSPPAAALNGQGFEAWWLLYRTRTGRGKDKQETREVYERLSAADKVALLKRTEDWFALRDRVKASGSFVSEAPDPKRYLRRRCWEDELEVPAAAGDDVPGGARNAVFARDQAEHGADPRWPAYEAAIRAGEREPGTWAGSADGART